MISRNGFHFASLLLLSSAVSIPALAVTRCVSSPGGGACFPTITAAIAASASGDVINVGPGTYTENVVVNKSLSLVGDRAVIDAKGLLRGIFVDGLDYPGISGVRVAGFTVKNAFLEGILVLNATQVSVSGNTVMNNNLALTPAGCTMLPSWEPGEAQDCGEGIHLQAADHTVVTNNIVQANAGGGVLVSDDTGATHHNLLSFNTISDNAAACGISLASHTPTSAALPTGVYGNTVYGNRVLRNGRSGGGGAGIGMFAAIGGEATYGNTIINNLVQENGHPGLSMHGHAPGGNLNDNMLVGNTIVNNGADTADAHTPGPTGINIYAPSASTGIIVSGNMIQGESYDIGLNIPSLVQVGFNNLSGLQVGVQNFGTGPVDATQNFWGCGSGPTQAGSCSMALGNNLSYTPWLQQGVPQQPNF